MAQICASLLGSQVLLLAQVPLCFSNLTNYSQLNLQLRVMYVRELISNIARYVDVQNL